MSTKPNSNQIKHDNDTVKDVLDDLTGPTGSVSVGYTPAGTGAVATTVHSKLREVKSFSDFGWSSDISPADQYTAIKNAWVSAISNGHDLLHPGGVCNTGENSMPFGRIDSLPPTALLDCKHVTIYGVGPTSVFHTSSVGGADVFQLNGAENLHLRNFKVTSAISGAVSGSNGVSVTGGFDGITIDHIWCDDLPFVDTGVYVDGGKALSIQTPVSGQTLRCGSLKATNIFANGCVYGLGVELDLVAASTMPTCIDVDIVAENCRQAVVISAGAATSAIPATMSLGIKIRAQAINCAQDVVLSRAHGVDVECQVITTKTKAQRILSYTGSKWFSADTIADVVALQCAYAHNSKVSITGNKGECANLVQIGGAPGGSSGLTTRTSMSVFYLGVIGTSASGDIVEIDSGGNIAQNCTFICQGTGTPSTAFYDPSQNNATVAGNLQTLKDVAIQGAVKFTYTNGISSYAEINYDDEAVTFQQTLGSIPSLRITKHLNSVGNAVFAVRNDGAISTAGRVGASAVSFFQGVLPVYTESNVLYGYVPVYGSYTP